MIEVEFIVVKKIVSDDDSESIDFVNQSLGFYKVEVIPRINETVFHEGEQPGYYRVQDVYHHIEPVSPIQVMLISGDDEDAYE